MMNNKFGLFKCNMGHYWSQSYIPIYSNNYYSRGIRRVENIECPTCKNPYCYELAIHAEGLEAVLFNNTYCFEGVYPSYNNLIKHQKDSILQELDMASFVPSDRIVSDYKLEYTSPEGYKALFELNYPRKTQKLILIVPPKHDLISKIELARKKDFKARRLANPPKTKTVLPEFTTDVIGTRIKIGDWVAYSSYSDSSLRIGKVSKILNKTVTLKTKNGRNTISGKSPGQIVKLPDDQIMLYLLAT